jgi:RND family efflux transporter MFP subunit
MGPFGAPADETGEQGIETFEVQRGNISQVVSTTGSVDSKTQNTLTLTVSGMIIEALDNGDTFNKGEVLVEVDNSDGLYSIEQQVKNIESIEGDLSVASSSLSTAKINYQEALDKNHIAIQLAETNTKKSEENTVSALVSLENANRSADLAYESAERALEQAQNEEQAEAAEEQLESAKISNQSSTAQADIGYEQSLLDQSSTYWNNLSNLQSAEAQIALTRENIEQAEVKLEQAQIKLDLARMDMESANEDLDDYLIIAPYDGMVLSTGYKSGEYEDQGSTGISIISNEYLVSASVSENDIARISAGNTVSMTLDAHSNKDFSGSVERIIPVPINEGGIIYYEVLIGFEDTDGMNIYHGLSANVLIETVKAEDVLFVPIQSVYKEEGKSYVDLLVSDQVDQESLEESVQKVEVTTGINDYYYIEITSGLKEGDIIVTSRL